MDTSSDRNLLIGILAWQLDFVSRDQLLKTFQAWMLDKSKTIDTLLAEQGLLDDATRTLLLALVAKHIERHSDDLQQSLAAISSFDSTVAEQLKELADPDLNASLDIAATQPISGTKGSRRTKPDDTLDTATLAIEDRDGSIRFRILRPHAQGGLGKVSVALDQDLNREVALKEIRDERADEPDNRERFLLEAEITGGLEHPGIIPVYGLGTYEDGRPFYAMRFIRGDSLQQALREFHRQAANQGGRDYYSMAFRRLIRRLVDVCNAIEYAHSRGVLHRDLKPGNIMLGKYGETLVVDWGLAKAVGRDAGRSDSEEPTLRPSSGSGSSETLIGQAVGTPPFMSPEQASGDIEHLSEASDVYSLGATLYDVIIGHAPVQGTEVAEVLDKVRNGLIQWPREIESRVPAALDAICRKAMALKPNDRYATATELAEDLELWLADEPVSCYQEPFAMRAGRWLRRNREWALGGAGILLTAAILLGLLAAVTRSKNIDLRIAHQAAEDQRNVALSERDRAEENLVTARQIALNILEIAERRLSQATGQEKYREEMMDRCLEMYRQLLTQSGDQPEFIQEYARVLLLSGHVKLLMNDLNEARSRLGEACEQFKRVVDSDSQTTRVQQYLIDAYRELGSLEKKAGDQVAAEAAYSEATQRLAILIAADADNISLSLTRALVDLELVALRLELLQTDEALVAAKAAADFANEQIQQDQQSLTNRIIYLLATARQVQVLRRLGRHDEAIQLAQDRIPVGTEWVQGDPQRDYRYGLGRLLAQGAKVLSLEETDSTTVDNWLEESTNHLQIAIDNFPNTPGYHYYLGESWRFRGEIDHARGELEKAAEAYQKSLDILEPLAEQQEAPSYKGILARTYAAKAELLVAQEDWNGAQEQMALAVDFMGQSSQAQPDGLATAQEWQTLQTRLEEIKTLADEN